MDLKLLIISCSLYTLTLAGCPSTCTCEDVAVLCIGKNLESIPSFESLEVSPAILDLSGNRINMIDNDDFTFDYSFAVKEIYLNNSEILDIESEAFNEMENLQELYLGENLLNAIHENLIENIPDMVLLDISSNYFSGDMPKIRSNSLEVLAIANSKITNVPDDSLEHLPNLKMLLLQQNNIKSINPVVFSHFEKDTFFIRLSYNVWECNCKTFELFKYLAKSKFIDTSEPYQCVDEESEYKDIYDKKGLQVLRSKCPHSGFKDSETSAYKKRPLAGAPEKQQNEPFSLVKENDSSKTTTTEDQFRNISNYFVIDDCQSADMFFGSGVSAVFLLFLLCTCVFLFGVLAGYYLNVLVTKSRSRKIETSDSKSKLIPGT